MKKKIFTLGVILFSCLNLLSLKAETAIPYLPQTNDFGGVTVTDLTAFYPSSGEYTIEADANAGVEIVMAGGIYRYTPESTGKVRFAHKNGNIFVYEGSVYKTTLSVTAVASFPNIHGETDDASAKTGIYSESNLIKNPGFETLGDAIGTDGNSFKGVNWLSNGYDYDSRSRVRLNIAELEGSEGIATFLLHGYGSPADYLAQNIGNLKAATYYKAVFTTWSHSNTGDGNYTIAVGNDVSDASVASSTFNTGPTSYVEMTQEFVFYNSGNAISEAYLTITRTSQAISHFDRMTLVEGVSLDTETTGVENLVYLAGNAYAPAFDLQEGEYFDMQPYVVNPDFDSNTEGWTTTTNASNKGIKEGTSDSHPGGVMAGSNFWENWNSTAFSGKMYQTIEGLPNGKYDLTMAVFSNTQPEDDHEWMFVYANEGETPVTATPGELKTVPANFSTVGYVNTGKLEIGLNMKEEIANWVGIDAIVLKYYGYSLPHAISHLQTQIQLAQETLVGEIMNNTVSANLSSALAIANAAISSSDQAVLEAATSGLSAASDSATVSIASYISLKEAIDNANTLKDQYTTFWGYNAYATAINEVTADYNQKDLTNEGVVAAIAKLDAALKACLFTQRPPFDATFAISNPSFEEATTWKENGVNVPIGWNLDYDFGTGSKDVVLHHITNHDGENNLNIWSGSVNYINFYQDVFLPEGLYTLKAFMRTEATYNESTFTTETKITDQELYAEIPAESGFIYSSPTLIFDDFDVFPTEWETSELSWREMTIDLEVLEDQLVRIGARSTGDGTSSKGWFQIDDFQLVQTYRNSIQTINVDGSEVTVRSSAGGIIVSSTKEMTLPIYSITGQLIKLEKVGAGDTHIPIAGGMYIINKVKVIVK